MMKRQRRYVAVALWLACIFSAFSACANTGGVTREREVYREAMREISRGRIESAERLLPALQNYPLLPYVELELLKAQIHQLSDTSIDAFVNQYRDTIVAQRVKVAWLYHLRRKGDWERFLRYYQREPVAGLECTVLNALYATGDIAAAQAKVAKTWLTGRSLPDECDPALKRWLGSLSAAEAQQQYWQRARLAIDAEQHKLAIYLLGKVENSRPLIELLESPERLFKTGLLLPVNDDSRRVAVLTLKRLARGDFEATNSLWHQLDRHLSFSRKQNYDLRDALARQIIASDIDYARDWLNANDPSFEDPYLTEWRVRLALKYGDWDAAQQYIAMLPENLRSKSDWRYWWARADIEKRQAVSDEARGILQQLATERGYYSFMAADMLNQEYRLASKRTLDPKLVEEVKQHSAIIRARELHWHGDHSTAKQEWSVGMRSLNKAEQVAAAQLALDWEWPHQAIVTAIRADEWDDLVLRFPTAYQKQFVRTAKRENIDLKWIYAIARQESAFAADARSPVGARGVMQIMPGTATTLARQMGTGRVSTADLLEPDTNIAMGGYYLGKLLERFDGNRILATAAYNAGPTRVERVLLRQDRNMPADIWIENLPYGETREYIKNVLAFSVIYGVKLDLDKPILARHERQISPRQVN